MCEIGSGVLSCTVQDTHVKRGYEMDFNYGWHKKGQLKPEQIMLDAVDWRMLHNSGSCIKTMREREPELYFLWMKETAQL